MEESSRSYSVHIITVSDGVHHQTRDDRSGDALESLLTTTGFVVRGRTVVPDEAPQIADAIRSVVPGARLVVTTGGTGFGPRDVTPEATSTVIDRPAPGLVHMMLSAGLQITAMSALSRPVVGSVGSTLVVNLPGSPKGATENLNAIIGVIPHALDLLGGDTEHGESPTETI